MGFCKELKLRRFCCSRSFSAETTALTWASIFAQMHGQHSRASLIAKRLRQILVGALMSKRTSPLWNTSLTQIMIAFSLVAEQLHAVTTEIA